MMRWIRRLALLFALVAVATGGAAWWGYSRVQAPFRGATDPETFVDIPSGIGPAGIGVRLVQAGVVQDAWTFRDRKAHV